MIDTKKYKKLLEGELKLLEEEMKELGRKNPATGEWEPVETDLNADMADDDEVADEMENFNENESMLLKNFVPQYKDIMLALEKIKKGTYGKCEVGGEDIPEERLMANAAAKTCIKHSK